MGQELSYTDIKHRRLGSLTHEERQDVRALLSLLSAEAVGLEDEGANHVTLNVRGSVLVQNALQVPRTATVGELVDWARMMAPRL